MSVIVEIPTPLRRFTGEEEEICVEGTTVAEALAKTVGLHPSLERHLFSEAGVLRSFVNIFVNEEDIRFLENGDTEIRDGDRVSIIPSIAGGAMTVLDRSTPPVQGKEPGIETELDLTAREIRRYSRHLIMPEVGTEGQRRLKAARVLMVGAGGLGSPLGLYLAAAGVGKLGLVDFDVVDDTNLHRQVLYTDADVGRPKLEAAIERLRGTNPLVEYVPYETRLDSSNALEIFEGYDLIVDGTDNFPTRYLVNDACVLTGKPNVYGSIFRFEGQVSVFWGAKGPCYRCLFPEPPPPGLVPSCAEGGVLGVLPGIIGSLQANEAIKLLIGRGDSLVGRLVLFDALKMRFRELKLRKNPRCPVCSPEPTVTELIDYEQFCGIVPQRELSAELEIDVHQLKAWRDEGREMTLLDVRNPMEVQICTLEGSKLIPLHELPDRLGELSTADEMVVYCRSGVRSAQAVEMLQEMGFAKAVNLAGGILAWGEEIDLSVPWY